MFTGIVQAKGRVVAPAPKLVIEAGFDLSDVALGDSIAISGVCLTVVSSRGSELSFDVSHETIERTTLGALGPGVSVNM